MTSKQITITATSGGYGGGNKAQIAVDGTEIGFGNYGRGINVAVFDENTGKPLFSTSFDTPLGADTFPDFVNALPTGRIVALAVKGDTGSLTEEAKNACKSLGSDEIEDLKQYQSFALIGIKGHAPGTAHESIDWSETTSSCSFDVEAVKATGGFVVEAISKPSTMGSDYSLTGGVAELKVNGNALSIGTSSGWNLAVLDRKSGAVKTSGSFDPNQEVDKFVETIQDLEPGEIVAIATQDYAGTKKVEQKVIKACASIGSTMVGKLKYGGNWAIVGYKGAKPGKAAENLSSYAPPDYQPQGVAVKYWVLPTEPLSKDLKVGQQLFLNGASERFGYESVGIDGDYAIVGDRLQKNASIYCWHDGQWQLQQQLQSQGLEGRAFGYSVDISGNLAIVSDPAAGKSYGGAAHIYKLKKDQWQHQQILLLSNVAYSDWFGRSVAIDGKKAIVGAPYDNVPITDCGAAYIFHQENGKWVQKGQKLQPLDPGYSDDFGISVNIYGDVAIVGAYAADAPGKENCGAAYIFHWEKGQWRQQRKLQPLDLGKNDRFGVSVAVAGNLAIVGAYYADVSGKGSEGAAYIYQLQDGEWQQHQKIFASDPNSGDNFGQFVAIGKDIALVGAPRADDKGKADCGAVYLFQLVNNKWEQKQKLQPSQLPAKAHWGSGIDLDGSRAIVGADGNKLTPKTGFANICDLTEEA